jgi:hypothetical protein
MTDKQTRAILAMADDPGGARAILPVLEALRDLGYRIWIVASGTLDREADGKFERIDADEIHGQADSGPLLLARGIGALCLGTSAKARGYLALAGIAREMGIPVVVVLDNWMNYRSRLVDERGNFVRPDVYAVMDRVAYQEAVEDGVPPEILRVTGHPGLGHLQEDIARWDGAAAKVFARQPGPGKRLVAFVSEPAALDDGNSPAAPRYRGYTELGVMKLLAEVLRPYRERLMLGILPHPREDKARLKAWCEAVFKDFDHVLYEGPLGRPAVLCASGSIGMTSILLYESWLAGKPTLSLQPGLIRDDLRNLQRREGLMFIDRRADAETGVARFMAELEADGTHRVREDVELHSRARGNLAREIGNRMSP